DVFATLEQQDTQALFSELLSGPPSGNTRADDDRVERFGRLLHTGLPPRSWASVSVILGGNIGAHNGHSANAQSPTTALTRVWRWGAFSDQPSGRAESRELTAESTGQFVSIQVNCGLKFDSRCPIRRPSRRSEESSAG